MSKAFLAEVIQDSAGLTGIAANRAASDLMSALVSVHPSAKVASPVSLSRLRARRVVVALWPVRRVRSSGVRGSSTER